MFERVGIATLKEMQKPMDKQSLQVQLKKACVGELRHLSPEQIANIKSYKTKVCLIAFAVAFITNIIPAKVETSLIWSLETNGMSAPYQRL